MSYSHTGAKHCLSQLYSTFDYTFYLYRFFVSMQDLWDFVNLEYWIFQYKVLLGVLCQELVNAVGI